MDRDRIAGLCRNSDRLSVRHTRALIEGTAARTTNIMFGFMNAEAVAIWIEGNHGT
jgi:hypothetical protein